METQIIGIKQLYRELSKISEAALRGSSFLVVKNSKPAFRIEPVDKTKQTAGKYTLQDFKVIQDAIKQKRTSGNLSKEVDKIVYGI